jgi:cytidylate kinase
MPIVTITRGSHSHGRELAETLAERLGYECFSREILREDASDQFNLPEIKFFRAIENPPSLLDRVIGGKEKYIAYLRSAFLKRVLKDNIIYHGFVGQFFLKDVPNVLKVLITANIKDRIKALMKREDISTEKAPKYLEKIDAARNKWSRHLYGIDTWDPNLYDMVFRIDNMAVADVVDNIANATRLPCFQISSKSRSILNDLALGAEVETKLLEIFPVKTHVSTKDRMVTVTIENALENKERAGAQIEKILNGIDGVKDFEILFKISVIGQ